LPPPAQAGKPAAEGACPPHLAATPRVAGAEAQQIVTKKRTDNGRFRGRNRASRAGRATVAERPQLGSGGMRPHSQLSKPPRPHHHESARSPAGAPRAWSTTTPSSPTSGTVVFPTLAEKLRHSGGARDTRPSPSCPQPAPPPRSSRRSSLHSFPTSRIRGHGGVKAERGRVAGAAMVASSGPDPAVGSSQ
jgi:hypothetical protein